MIPVVTLTRGGLTESTHYGSVCLVKDNGEKIFEYGDTISPIFMRSTLKPFQALSLFSSKAVQKFKLDRKLIAIATASHVGSIEHRTQVSRLLEAIGVDQSKLQCGTHWPIDRDSIKELYLSERKPDSLFHNCSGKHADLLATTKSIGADLDLYLDPNSPTQMEVRRVLQEFSEDSNLILGIDGCSAPNYATSLFRSALALSRFAGQKISEFKEGCSEILLALSENAELLRGKDQFDTILTKKLKGAGFSKIGAEGMLAIALRSNGSSFGLMIKISDGDPMHRAGYAVALKLLERFKLVDDLAELKLKFGERHILNAAKKVTGEIKVLC